MRSGQVGIDLESALLRPTRPTEGCLEIRYGVRGKGHPRVRQTQLGPVRSRHRIQLDRLLQQLLRLLPILLRAPAEQKTGLQQEVVSLGIGLLRCGPAIAQKLHL